MSSTEASSNTSTETPEAGTSYRRGTTAGDHMAFQGQIPIEFGLVFPSGAYAAGGIEMVRDFDRSSGDRVVQQVDKHTGLPLWVVEVIDAQEDARQRTVKVKIAAQVQPVLPSPAPGSPFLRLARRSREVVPDRGCIHRRGAGSAGPSALVDA